MRLSNLYHVGLLLFVRCIGTNTSMQTRVLFTERYGMLRLLVVFLTEFPLCDRS